MSDPKSPDCKVCKGVAGCALNFGGTNVWCDTTSGKTNTKHNCEAYEQNNIGRYSKWCPAPNPQIPKNV